MSAGEDLPLRDYTDPGRSCDIVMKGGITSGVVYPHAVCELASTYRFRNVGGTSAGAIAAAATAAAEYGRDRAGFNNLAGLPAWIGAEGNLQSLFQPQRSTRRLFAVLIAAIDGGPLRAVRAAAVRHLPEGLFGAAIGLALLAIAVVRWDADGAGSLVVAAAVVGGLLAVLGAAVAIVVSMALQAMRAIPDNGFGLCSGGPGAAKGRTAALTPWLTDLLNDTAGLPQTQPLTFGHLWAGPGRARDDWPRSPDDRELQLAMMTTNLTNRCAHQLPWDNREWFFDPAEFRRLFPPKVVEWMEAHPPPPRPHGDTPRERRESVQRSAMRLALMHPLLPLPDPADLPVVVAARMSLSFPVLLSAVPLWQIDMTREENEALDHWRDWATMQGEDWDPLADKPEEWPSEGQPGSRPFAERCWFSDGGISSNFPVHFFDRLVPRWPTFAINLRPFAEGRVPDASDQAKNTSMVERNKDGIRRWWYRLPGRPRLGIMDRRLAGFLSSVVRTMQNRVDEAQMRVPGYRDRVAHVSMSKTEGGMNLTMPAEDIVNLTVRGREAAKRLLRAYTPPDPADKAITWDNHRWVRLRSSLAVLEEMQGHFAAGYCGPPESGEATYAQLLRRGRDTLPDSYRWREPEQLTLAAAEIDAILQGVAAKSQSDSSVARGAPHPRPQGRIAPTD